MSIVSRRTIGQILLAYDDGISPPIEVLPLGSLVSVADGTLWISLGGGTYAQASGGGALGDSTVWSSRTDWADLGTLPSGDIRSGDLAPISDLGGVSISYGTAIYNGGWALFSGYFQDPADLIAFTQPINTGAVVSVGAANEDGIRYYYDGGQWVRTPDATGYFWQSAPDWPTLLTTFPIDNLRSGDFCLATSLDIAYGAAYGIATWDGTAWKLFLGVFESVADMEAFAIAYSVTYGAVASVYPGAVDSELSVRYYYDGTTWFRTPDGTHYIYPSVPDWASLPTADTILNNDEVGVDDLGYTGSSGVAQWHVATPEWRLIKGQFTSVADMLAFDGANPVHNLATARVKSTVPFNDRSIVYIHHSGVWTRSGVTTTEGYAWTLTETQLLTGSDPSGIGAVQDGDYGTYTPAGGAPVVVRYKAACTVAVGAGGGTRPVWMIPEAYAGTPVVVAYLTGSETGVLATTLAAQGWTVTTTGSGAGQGVVSLVDGYVRCQTAASAGGGSAQVISPTWLGSQKFSVQGLLRGTAAGTDPYLGLLQVNNNDIQYTFMRGNLSGVFRHFTLSGSWTTVDSLNSLPSPTLNLDPSTPWFFQTIGRTLAENTETRINGELYGSMRRNLDNATTASAMNLALYSNGGAGGTTSTLDSKTLTVLTY